MNELQAELEALDRARALLDQAAATPGGRVDREMYGLLRTFSVFVRNASELRHRIDADQVPDTAFRVDEDELERVLDEIDRLLHNFLAAAYTLSQHTMKLRNRYLDKPHQAAYAKQAPFEKPVFKLVTELRNSSQHSRLPIVRQQLSRRLVGDTLEQSVTFFLPDNYLDVLDLPKSTREHYRRGAHEDPPALADVIAEYTADVVTFFRWFTSAVTASQHDNLAATNQIRQAAQALVDSTSLGRTAKRAEGSRPTARPPGSAGTDSRPT